MAKISTQTLLGILILILGILFLIRNLEIYDTGQLLQYIPSLFILLGIYILIKSRFTSITGPVIIILIATFVQLLVLEIVTWGIIFNWWPIIFILIGLDILFKRKRRPSFPKRSDPKVDIIAVFDEVNLSNNSPDFKGGNIVSILGETELDLRDAVIGSSPVKVDITVLLGEIDIIIPEDWWAEIDVLNVLGDIYDKRRSHSNDRESTTKKPDIIITGTVILGDFTIKHS
ncbi:putative transmembrane protein [Methanosalsum zhilinae DSM 4017]|uniref:Putative transmembrane protein n=1 Tax=Methanosalsum zhilinae (strain DSM 4017 / NBRC 107636 / OCM 62 / WeN5) TaxID=679901 RepID=F7XN47_METZD|nr:LiaF domain-containing protein [Methanosalsum zhilinae]AEH61165.1 putative transmembrane protein [Methanosalsum zhilinae DSM 4017]